MTLFSTSANNQEIIIIHLQLRSRECAINLIRRAFQVARLLCDSFVLDHFCYGGELCGWCVLSNSNIAPYSYWFWLLNTLNSFILVTDIYKSKLLLLICTLYRAAAIWSQSYLVQIFLALWGRTKGSSK